MAEIENYSIISGDYEIENGMLTKYKGEDEEVVLPSGISAIGKESFYVNDTITSVEIPEGVLVIGSYAFYLCENLTSVKLPSTILKISADAFSNTGLTKIVIPYGCEEIGEDCFTDCQNLLDIFVPETVTNIGGDAFCTFNDDTVIHTHQGSAADYYALENGYNVEYDYDLNAVEYTVIDADEPQEPEPQPAQPQTTETPSSITTSDMQSTISDLSEQVASMQNKNLTDEDRKKLDNVMSILATLQGNQNVSATKAEPQPEPEKPQVVEQVQVVEPEKPKVIEPTPVVEPTKPQVVEQVQVVVEPEKPKIIEPTSVVESTKPQVVEPAPVVETTKPQVVEPAPVVETTKPQVVEPAPVVENIVEQVPAEPEKMVEKTTPITPLFNMMYQPSLLQSVEPTKEVESAVEPTSVSKPVIEPVAEPTPKAEPVAEPTLSEEDKKYAELAKFMEEEFAEPMFAEPKSASKPVEELKQENPQIAPQIIENNAQNGEFIIKNNVLTKYLGKSNEVTIPDNVSVIADEAFANCDSISVIHYGKNITFVGKRAFQNLINLQEIDLSETQIKEIDEEAFSGCVNVKKLKLSNVVEMIGKRAFAGVHVRGVKFPKTVKKVGSSAFNGIAELVVYDTIDADAASANEWNWDRVNGTVNSQLACAMLDAPNNFFGQSEITWRDYLITVMSSTTNEVRYKIFCDGNENEEYHAMMLSAWGKNASFLFDDYDAFFEKSTSLSEKTEMAFCRLMFPEGLSVEHKMRYRTFLEKCMGVEKNAVRIAKIIAKKDSVNRLKFLAKIKALNANNVSWIREQCKERNAKQCLAFLAENF